MKYSVQNSPRFNPVTHKPTREDRRNKLRAWAGITWALLKARGKDPEQYSEAKRAMMFYRRRKLDGMELTHKRYAPQARVILKAKLKEEG